MAATSASTVTITAAVASRNSTTITRLLRRARCCCWKNDAGVATPPFLRNAPAASCAPRPIRSIRAAAPGRLGRFERLRRAEAERAGEHRCRQRFAPRVVFHHRVVIGLPRKGHFVLGAGKLFLEPEHVLVRLEIGILLEHRHHPPEGAAEHAFGAPERLHRGRVAGTRRGRLRGADRAAARLDHRVERAPLVLHVTLHRFDQVWNEVIAPLQLHIDLRERILEPVAQLDQAVIDGDQPEDDGEDDRQYHDCCNTHIFIPPALTIAQAGALAPAARRTSAGPSTRESTPPATASAIPLPAGERASMPNALSP